MTQIWNQSPKEFFDRFYIHLIETIKKDNNNLSLYNDVVQISYYQLTNFILSAHKSTDFK